MTRVQTGFLPADVRAGGPIKVSAASQPTFEEIHAAETRARAIRNALVLAGLKRAYAYVMQPLSDVGAAVEARGRRRRELDSLARMTDRQLADVGLTRADLWRFGD